MVFGSGMQTWEYSPDYALRSYAYLGLHALPIALLRACGVHNKVRCLDAMTRFFKKIISFRIEPPTLSEAVEA